MLFSKKIAIDLGTTNTRVHLQGRGIIAQEPSILVISDQKNILAIGEEAKVMLGKTPEMISAHQPLQDGAIADYRVTEGLLRHFINKAVGRFRLINPEVMISVSAGITSTERRAVIDAAISAGAREAYLIKHPLAAAIGANIPLSEPLGNFIVDIGGGTTEVAVLSLGGIVVSESVRVGGNKFDESIIEYMRKQYGLSVGPRTAEEIKINVGSAIPMKEPLKMNIRGRDLVSGLPKVIEVNTNDVVKAITDELEKIILAIKKVLEQTPPELSADIIDHGIVLSGGGAQMRSLADLISHHTGVPTIVVEEPMLCVVRGVAVALENLESYKRSLIGSKH
ncbi:MAG: rod shape-determining protein [Candidatus Abawacabacteria bacterium RBG_16_42_10]|uniref:Cell shape-determining protein MreB n=1 Tax=Candidatus Abawacabacteria bacterium RBG_16_42_10 TaxID=1817814 RepID=A0A1F4XJP1_9BACT|nr:MAG: rod shape-determining protein [Candidatus Abawacabacteria bacterium RBG_16_42_10]